jgi:hypothetical protein
MSEVNKELLAIISEEIPEEIWELPDDIDFDKVFFRGCIRSINQKRIRVDYADLRALSSSYPKFA